MSIFLKETSEEAFLIISPVADDTDCAPPSFDGLQALWKEIQQALRDENTEVMTQNWLSSLAFLRYDGGKVLLSAPTRFARDWIRNNLGKSLLERWQHVMPAVLVVEIMVGRPANTPLQVTGQHSDHHVTLDFKTEGRQTSITINQEPTEPSSDKVSDSPRVASAQPANQSRLVNSKAADLNWALLNPHYTFEHFVVADANKVAYKAARCVAEGKAGFTFNPLCIYGASGLGKTHLMHAIAHGLRAHCVEKKVMYLSAEQFMFRFVDALRSRDTQTFKQQFRSVDVLLVDDFQFIAGKESTQDEFFHTFNALMDNKKQIVISADRLPHTMHDIGERIRSRLSSGLIVDMGEADYALRLGVLQAKRELIREEYPTVTVPLDVMEFLACHITANVRELEGALNRLVAHAAFVERPIMMEMIHRVIGDLLENVPEALFKEAISAGRTPESAALPVVTEPFTIRTNKSCSSDKIFQVITGYYQVSVEDLLSSSRSKKHVMPRQVAMALCKIMTSLTLMEIGGLFGGRDHSTVVHALRKIDDLQQDEEFLTVFVALQEQCLARVPC